jgi:uncharacterized membrane protein
MRAMSSKTEPGRAEHAPKQTARLEALSDGIFAIAMTLLVLDIHAPVIRGGESLLRALIADWPTHLAFLIGFFTLLVCWINHHYMFELIQQSNGVLLVLNGFKLLVVSFTPFATSLLAKYIGTTQQQTAVGVYTLNFLFMGLSMTCLWSYARWRGLARAAEVRVLQVTTHLYLLATILPAAIFALSFVSVWSCLALSGVMFMVFLFPRGLVGKLAREQR